MKRLLPLLLLVGSTLPVVAWALDEAPRSAAAPAPSLADVPPFRCPFCGGGIGDFLAVVRVQSRVMVIAALTI